MERIRANTVMPEEGEIMDFEDVYPGVTFGAKSYAQQFIGKRGGSNPKDICVRFHTGTVSEVMVGFKVIATGTNMMALYPPTQIIIADHPYAEMGDAGNVVEQTYNVKGSAINKENINTFMSADRKDPRGEQIKRTFNFYTKSFDEQIIPARPDGGLVPDTDFYVTLRLHNPVEGREKTTPFVLAYFGTDEPLSGGEEPIMIMPVDIPTDGLEAVPMSFAGVPGLFVPN